MKTNFTFIKYAILFIVLHFSFSPIKAQNTSYDFNFNSAPTLISGSSFAIGAKYKFSDVAAAGVYAEVTIVGATGGATVDILDDNTTTKPEAFSPKINIPALSTGMVEFKIEFFNSNGTPKVVQELKATAMDIDGSATIHEMDALDMGSGSLLSYLSTPLYSILPTFIAKY